MRHCIVIPVSDGSCVGEARRAAARKSTEAQLSEVDQGRVAIIATELASNLVKHAQNGKLILQTVDTPSGRAVELLSIDSGPGIANVEQSLQDGFSTAGTPGNGLGAIRRLSTEFDIYSQRPRGTVIMARVTGAPDASTGPVPQAFMPAASSSGQPPVTWNGISICAPGEEVCGDTWRLHYQDRLLSVMIADGLGHGPLAAEASGKAAAAFEANPLDSAGSFLQKAHQALAGTRGAAIAIARIQFSDGFLKFAGTGNIAGSLICGEDSRGLCSHNGIVGVQLRKVQEFEYTIQETGMLVMHSDGMQSRWGFDEYPGIKLRHPAVIAGVLFRDFVRGRDDVTVVVARWNSFKASAS